MGVATGPSLQSVRFNAQNVPYGHYDLCVIANGISSHCISYCHHRPKKSCGCETRGKHGHEGYGREVCEDPCCCEETVIDPEIVELKEQLKRLQSSVYRLASLSRIEALVREAKETRKAEETEEDGKEGKSKRK